MNFYGIILAAGEGRRMKADLPKPLQLAGGRALIDYVTEAVSGAGVNQLIYVLGHGEDMLKKHLPDDANTVCQEERLGTGHAAMKAIESISDENGTVMIVCGDRPMLTAEVLKGAYNMHRSSSSAATVVSANCDNPDLYRRFYRSGGASPDRSKESVNEIRSGVYIFNLKKLRYALSELMKEETDGEYYLTDIISAMLKDGESIGGYTCAYENILSVNNMIQLAEVDRMLNARKVDSLMLSGVRIINPETVRVDFGVTVGCDTVIYPNTILENGTKIGKNCTIGPNTRISSGQIGDGTEVQSSVLLDCEIGSNTTVGPFAYVRPNSKIGDNIKVGDFVEVKNSTIGNGTKISHLTYVGDSDVGERVNFGCGTVTVNYDGISKHRTQIGDDCFIGCNTNLVAPVTVKERAYTAAGSTITDEVAADSLAIARARQVVKDGWVQKKRKK